MRTKRLGHLDIDESRLSEELDRSIRFTYAEQYAEFQCGLPWKTCMLWSRGGDVGDGVIARHDTSQPSQATVFGEQLPYLRQVVEESFAIEHLLFGRLVVMSDNVLVPHRDFVEFTERSATDRATHRLHVPLSTSPDCLFMEDNTIYRMPFSDVWSLDVTRMHSAGVLSDFRRVHLILDFADTVPWRDLLKFEVQASDDIPVEHTIARPPLSDEERAAILDLAGVVDLDNLTQVFGIVIKKQYRRDGGPKFVWDTIEEIGRRSGDPSVIARIDELFKHCMLERDE